MLLLTHGHFDHTTAVRPILERYPDLPVYINEKDVVDGRLIMGPTIMESIFMGENLLFRIKAGGQRRPPGRIYGFVTR